MESIYRKQPLITLNKQVIKIRRTKKVDLIDLVAGWLEAEDTDFVKTVAYSIGIITGLFMIFRLGGMLL
ncbi:MAG: hypothetical protein LRZ99_02080 [Desulfotomaculum sp.]|nr:hypothetical protein [Desulfotomaculum sp.]MCL0081585.1 hypothetical protein [Peptococcaceae bacterium]